MENEKGPYGLPTGAYVPPVELDYRCGTAQGSATGPVPVVVGDCIFLPAKHEAGMLSEVIRWTVIPTDRIDHIVGVGMGEKDVSLGARVGADTGVAFEMVMVLHWRHVGGIHEVDFRGEEMTGIDLTVGGLTRDRDVQSMVGNLVDPPNIVPAVGPQISVHSLLFSHGSGFLSERSDLLAELQVEGTPETTVHADFRLPGNYGKVTSVDLTLPQEAKALTVSANGARGVLTDLPRELDLTIGSSFARFQHSGTSLDGTVELGASTVSFEDLPQRVWMDWDMEGFFGDCGSDDPKPVIDLWTSRAPWGTDLEVEIVQDTMTTSASVKNLERLDLDLDLAEKEYRVEMEFVQQTGEVAFQIDGVEHDEECRPRSMESSVVGTELGEANLGVQDREPELSMGAHLGPRGRFVAMMAIEFFGWDTIPEVGLDRQAGSDCLVQDSYRILLPFRLDACLLEGQCNTYTLPTHLVGMCALEAS